MTCRRDIFGLRALAVRDGGRLSREELVAVLVHCVAHRGWKPVSKGDLIARAGSNTAADSPAPAGTGADDDSKMKSAIEAMNQRLAAGYRSLGDLLGRIECGVA